MIENEIVVQAEYSLKESIQTLYSRFASYRLKPHMDACPCCVYDNDKQRIQKKPLKELTITDLEKYAFKAMTTWGDDNDFRHFLPRLFELQAFEPMALCETEVLFGKLSYANWRTWPVAEQQALEKYFISVWQYLLVVTEPASDIVINEYLCGIAQAIDNLEPFLSFWQKGHNSTAIRNLIAFIDQNLDTLQKGLLGNAFWKGREDQRQEVINWLLNPLTHQSLQENHIIQTDEGLAQELIILINQLPKLPETVSK